VSRTLRVSPLTLALLSALAASPALAQTATGPEVKTSTLDTIVVTGTRTSTRTVAESSAPIDIITPEALEATGTVELATALSRALPSLNFPRPAITDGTDAVRPAQLRGLAPDQVLVLVNGKRRHTTALINLNGSQGRGSSPVDLNAIPIASIERVEVLRDGASAQYGSDAIAGVINIVLKSGADGGNISGRLGKYSAGDGEQYQFSGDAGFKLGATGYLHLAGQAGHQDNTDRARPFILPPAGLAPPVTAPIPAIRPPLGKVVQRYGDPEIDHGAISYNAAIGPADGVSFYSFGSFSRRDVVSNGFFRPAGDARNDRSIYPDGFLPQINNVSEDQSFVVGVKTTTGNGWGIDLSYNYGQNHLSFDILNTLNRSLGPTSPTEFYAGALEVSQNVFNLDIDRAFDVGWMDNPVNFAVGAEWRGEKFTQSAGEPNSYADTGLLIPVPGSTSGATQRAAGGSQVFPGFRPSDAGKNDRHSYSFYADLEAEFNDKFSAGIAARYENYSDFGTTTSGKLSARYAFTDKVALRGTISTGFRAPSLQQQFFQSTATNFIGGVPFDVRTFAVDNPTAIALGSEPLKAEESTNYGLGLVLQPIEGLYITADAYRIDIKGRISLSENLIGPAVTTFLQNRGIFGVTGGRYFTNAVDTKTTGIDLIGTYGWTVDSGKVEVTAGYNHSKTEIERIAPNPPELTSGGLNLQRIGRVEQGRITVGAPRDKFMLGGSWNTGNWTFSSTATRYGEFTVLFDAVATTPSRDQTFGPEWTLDLAASYKLDQWDFTIGGDNVLDAYPDEVIYQNSTFGQLPYSAASPFGFNGAFMYVKAGYSW
jgi:iron complex outermembrane receptor protein